MGKLDPIILVKTIFTDQNSYDGKSIYTYMCIFFISIILHKGIICLVIEFGCFSFYSFSRLF